MAVPVHDAPPSLLQGLRDALEDRLLDSLSQDVPVDEVGLGGGELEEDEESPQRLLWRRYGPTLWRVGALLLNFLQAHYAQKAFHRAALQRDEEIPKFPLF